jgi:hypothetical protein
MVGAERCQGVKVMDAGRAHPIPSTRRRDQSFLVSGVASHYST